MYLHYLKQILDTPGLNLLGLFSDLVHYDSVLQEITSLFRPMNNNMLKEGCLRGSSPEVDSVVPDWPLYLTAMS